MQWFKAPYRLRDAGYMSLNAVARGVLASVFEVVAQEHQREQVDSVTATLAVWCRWTGLDRRSMRVGLEAIRDAGILKIQATQSGQITIFFGQSSDEVVSKLCESSAEVVSNHCQSSVEPLSKLCTQEVSDDAGFEAKIFPKNRIDKKRIDKKRIEKKSNAHAQAHTREIEDAFEHFWARHPGGGSKVKARQSYLRQIKTIEQAHLVVDALAGQIAAREFVQSRGQWVPMWRHVVTWLNQRGWEDAPLKCDERGVSNAAILAWLGETSETVG